MMSPALLLRHQRDAIETQIKTLRRYPEKSRGRIRTLKQLYRDYNNALQMVTGKVPVHHEKPQGNDVKGYGLEMGFNFLTYSKGSKQIGFGVQDDQLVLWLDQSEADHEAEERRAFFIASNEQLHAPAGYTILDKVEVNQETLFIYGSK